MDDFFIEVILLPKLFYCGCVYHNMNASAIETQLQVLNESLVINSALNTIAGKQMFFQHLVVCDEYIECSESEFSFKYPLTYLDINETNACQLSVVIIIFYSICL